MTAVYYALCILSVIFAFLAQQKSNKFLFLLSLISVCVVSGFRGESVGIDTETYYTYIDWISKGIIKTGDIEFGFIQLTTFLLNIGLVDKYIIAVYSILTLILIYSRFWTLRKNASFSLMVFIFLAFYLQLSMNIMRQFLSIAFLFAGTYFLEKRRWLVYLIFVLLASLFHLSGVLGLVIWFIFFFIYNPKRNQKVMVGSILILLSPFILMVVQQVFSSYSTYFENVTVDIGFLMVAKFAVLVLFIWTNQPLLRDKTGESSIIKICALLYGLGIILTSLGYIFLYMERIGLVFMMFEPVMLAMMCFRGKERFVYRMVTIALCLFIIYMNFTANGNGVFPYTWIL